MSKAPKELNLFRQLVDIRSVVIPGLASSFNEFINNKKNAFIVHDAGKNYVATYLPLPKKLPGNWLIGVVVPEYDFIGVIKRANLVTLSNGFVILMLGIALVSKLINLIVNPLKEISHETERIKQFDLESEHRIQSKITELNDISNDIYSMKAGLPPCVRLVVTLN